MESSLRFFLFSSSAEGKTITMVKPELKSLISPDIEYGVSPPDPENCAIPIEAEIGAKGQKGADLFQFTIITPQYCIENSCKENPSVHWGRGYLLINSFSWAAVEKALQKLFLHCERSSWSEVAEELNKYMDWEFDNYTD